MSQVIRSRLFPILAVALVVVVIIGIALSSKLSLRDLRGAYLPPNNTDSIYIPDITYTSGNTGTADVWMYTLPGSAVTDIASFQFVIMPPATPGLTNISISQPSNIITYANNPGTCNLNWETSPTTTPANGFLVKGTKGFCGNAINPSVTTNQYPGVKIATINFTFNPVPQNNTSFHFTFANGQFTAPGNILPGPSYTQFYALGVSAAVLIPALSDVGIGGTFSASSPGNVGGYVYYTPILAPSLQFNAATYTATEGQAATQFFLSMNPAASTPTSVNLVFPPGGSFSISDSATLNTGGTLTVTIPSGPNNVTLFYTAPSDANATNETGVLDASALSGTLTATVQLTNIDSTTGLSFNAPSYSIIENGAAVPVIVTANPTPTANMTVTATLAAVFTTTPSATMSATQNGVYATTPLVLNFTPTSGPQTFYIKAPDENGNTTNETSTSGIVLSSSNPSYTQAGNITLNVVDDDAPNVASIDFIPMLTSNTFGVANDPIYFPYYGVKAHINYVGPGNVSSQYIWTSVGTPIGNQSITTITRNCLSGVPDDVFLGNTTNNVVWARTGRDSRWELTVNLYNGASCSGLPSSQVGTFSVENAPPLFVTNFGPANLTSNITWNTTDSIMEVKEDEQGFVYNMRAQDADNDSMTYAVTSVTPSGAIPGFAIDAHSATTNAVALRWNSPYPQENRVGDMTVVVTATDSYGAAVNQMLMIRVKNVNDAPVISSQNNIVNNQTNAVSFSDGSTAVLSFPVTNGETNISSNIPPLEQVITVTATIPPAAQSWITFNANTRELTAIPTQAQVGQTGTIVINASDLPTASPLPAYKWDTGVAQNSTFTFNYNVINTNDPPVISSNLPATFSTTEDTPLVLNLTNYGTDPDTGDTVSWNVINPTTGNTNSGTTGGTVFDLPGDISIDTTGKIITITPNANAYNAAPITITLQLSDNHNATATTTRTVTWTPVNDAPVVATDVSLHGSNIHLIEPVAGTEDTPLTVNLAAYKYDVDDLPGVLTYTPVVATDFSVTQIQSASFAGDVLTVNPANNFNGNATIKIRLKDDQQPTNAISTDYSLVLNFTPVSDAPAWLDWPGKVGSGASNLYNSAYVGNVYIFPLDPNVLEPDTGDNLYFTTSMQDFTLHTTPGGVRQYRWTPQSYDLGGHDFEMYVSNTPITMQNATTNGGVPAGSAPAYLSHINVLPASNAPTVVYAHAVDATHVELTYNMSADLLHGSPEDESKYSLSSGLTVQNVAALNNIDFVMTTSSQTPGQNYTLTINGVKFTNGSYMNNYTVQFQGYGAGQPCTTNCPPPPPPSGSGLLGDANSSNTVTSADALLVLQYYVGLRNANDLSLCRANADQSSGVTSADALKILQKVVGTVTLGTVTCP